MIADFLEVAMLLCFACSWPFSIRRAWRSRTALGKSIEFNFIVILGYFCGIGAKIVSGNINFVVAFYLLDIFLVSTDIVLYFRNRRFDRERQANKSS